jgi:hypothetical protein
MYSSLELPGDADLLMRSLLFREWQAECEEVLRHKWCESERAGRDIGMDNARVSWVVHHRARWLKERRNRWASAF